MVCASQNWPHDKLWRQHHCECLLLLLTTTFLLSSGFRGAAGQWHQAASQSCRRPAHRTWQTAQPNTGAGGQGTRTIFFSFQNLSSPITPKESMAWPFWSFILVSPPSCSQLGGVEEGMSNFDDTQVPFWVRDCCAAKPGAMARTHDDQEHSSEILSSNSVFWLLLFYLPYHCFPIGLLPLSSFLIFTPIGSHVLQSNMCHRNAGYNWHAHV